MKNCKTKYIKCTVFGATDRPYLKSKSRQFNKKGGFKAKASFCIQSLFALQFAPFPSIIAFHFFFFFFFSFHKCLRTLTWGQKWNVSKLRSQDLQRIGQRGSTSKFAILNVSWITINHKNLIIFQWHFPRYIHWF